MRSARILGGLGLSGALILAAIFAPPLFPAKSAEKIAKEALERSPPGEAKVLVVGDGAAADAIDAASLRHAVSYAGEGRGTKVALSVVKGAYEAGASPLCVLAAFSFQQAKSRGPLPSRPPSLPPEELAALKELLAFLRQKGAPLVLLRVPFARSAPAAEVQAYWLRYEELLYAAEGAFRFLSPAPLHDEQYEAAGRLNEKGRAEMTGFLREQLASCYR